MPDSVPIHPRESPAKPWISIHLDFEGPYLGKTFLYFNLEIFRCFQYGKYKI